jgi:PKD repeat protein
VRYVVTCRDPNQGRLVATVAVSGDSADPDGFAVRLAGIADDPTLPDSVRIVSRRAHVPGSPGTGLAVFDNLLPGDYEVRLDPDSIAPPCTPLDDLARQAPIAALVDDTVSFSVDCPGNGGAGGEGRPYVWRNLWSASSAPAGTRVTLELTLDVSADTAERVAGAQAELRYNATTLSYDSVSAGALGQLTVNAQTAGTIFWLATTFSTPPGGIVQLARFHFTVTGSPGSTAATRTTLSEVQGLDPALLDTLIRVVEDTLTVGGPGANQPPQGEANGPYSGAAGAAVAFSAAGSADPDGTIVSYAWTFGDGGSATGPSPTHSYTAAGTYTATLTVTDNGGATATDQATVTVTSGSGGSLPFTWRGAFGAINPADSVVALTLTLDLTTDIPETPGPEALATFVVDSLKWDATVLRYHAFTWGPGGAGVLQTTAAMQGRLTFSSFTLPASANSGVITLAIIRFKVTGTSGRSTTTATALGPLTSTVATGSYDYRPKTDITEATVAVP